MIRRTLAAAFLPVAAALALAAPACQESRCVAICRDLGYFYDDCLFEARRGWDAWPGEGVAGQADFIDLCLDEYVSGGDEAWCEERWPAGLNPASCEEGWSQYGWDGAFPPAGDDDDSAAAD